MKTILRASCVVFGILGVVGMITAFTLAIWTGDERWAHTGIVGMGVAFVGIAAATYPGWNY